MTESSNAWTEERLAQLRSLWDEGLSISQIGDALGVSRNAIAGKAHRLGLLSGRHRSPRTHPKPRSRQNRNRRRSR